MTPPTICKQHGRQPSALVCPHVRDAVRAGTQQLLEFKPVSQELPPDLSVGKGLAYHLCVACIEAYSIYTEKGVPWPGDDVNDAEAAKLLPNVQPLCIECLREYEAADATKGWRNN
jgi:hypothetical protein